MTRRETLAVLALLLAVLLLAAIWPSHAQSDVPAVSGVVPAGEFEPLRSAASGPPTAGYTLGVVSEPATGSSPGGAPQRPRTPSPSVRAVPSVAPVHRTQRILALAPAASVTGIASTYGPGFDGYLALPAGPGIHVRICGAGGCIDRVSNDAGPVPSLHRVADLSVADFERVCGVPWTRGLCRVSVEAVQ